MKKYTADMPPISYDQNFTPASLQDTSPSIVDSLESALAHYRKENKLDKLRELSKPTNNHREVTGSVNIDRTIRVGLPGFIAMWLKSTETLIALHDDLVSRIQAKSDPVDQLVHIHAEEHFYSFGSLDKRYLNTSGFGAFNTNGIPLKLPATFAIPSSNPHHGLLSLPPEVLTEIFSLLSPTADYGRGALALTCKYLAAASLLAPPIYRTPSLVATGAAVSIPDSHRCCPGCGYLRSIVPAYWSTHFAAIRKLWAIRRLGYDNHPCPNDIPLSNRFIYDSTEPYNAFQPKVQYRYKLKVDQELFDDSVTRWRKGLPHSHAATHRTGVLHCIKRNQYGIEDVQTPLCPSCVAQHAWEIGVRESHWDSRYINKKPGSVNRLDEARKALLFALQWRRDQFLDVFPNDRSLFKDA